MEQVFIIGGGLSGLANAIWLAKKGHEVTLVEKNDYPRHKVCGEYVSREVLPFFEELGLMPLPFDWPGIERLQVTSPAGNTVTFPLDLGGFGVSRYKLDHHLYLKAKAEGVKVYTKTKINEVVWKGSYFNLKTAKGNEWQAEIVIGNYGKRANLDRQQKRGFLRQSAPYVGVKHHIRASLPNDLIALHNAQDAYCGISKIEDDRHCFCYLANRDAVKEAGSIENFERNHLARNPFLNAIINEADFLFDQPEVIGEVSFANKTIVQDHMLMGGDAAGMIAPLCGNGMAMAFHSAKLLAPLVDQFLERAISREILEKTYKSQWQKLFQKRLQTGRHIQKWLFGVPNISEIAVDTARHFPYLGQKLVEKTHGKPF